MGSLEDLIYQRLAAWEALAARLARYGGKPAVFHQRAPDDTADGWEDGRQCPRLGYAVDWRTNAERKTRADVKRNLDKVKIFLGTCTLTKQLLKWNRQTKQ